MIYNNINGKAALVWLVVVLAVTARGQGVPASSPTQEVLEVDGIVRKRLDSDQAARTRHEAERAKLEERQVMVQRAGGPLAELESLLIDVEIARLEAKYWRNHSQGSAEARAQLQKALEKSRKATKDIIDAYDVQEAQLARAIEANRATSAKACADLKTSSAVVPAVVASADDERMSLKECRELDAKYRALAESLERLRTKAPAVKADLAQMEKTTKEAETVFLVREREADSYAELTTAESLFSRMALQVEFLRKNAQPLQELFDAADLGEEGARVTRMINKARAQKGAAK